MKIVTVNVPQSYIDAMERLVGDDGLYPSRSELIRVAVREFLLKELKMAKKLPKLKDKDPKTYIRIPVDTKIEAPKTCEIEFFKNPYYDCLINALITEKTWMNIQDLASSTELQESGVRYRMNQILEQYPHIIEKHSYDHTIEYKADPLEIQDILKEKNMRKDLRKLHSFLSAGDSKSKHTMPMKTYKIIRRLDYQ